MTDTDRRTEPALTAETEPTREEQIASAAAIIAAGGHIVCDPATYAALLASSEKVAEFAGVAIMANRHCPPNTMWAVSRRVVP